MAERVKEVAVGEAERIRDLSVSAARSGTYLYPIKGIAYFLTHRELSRPLRQRLASTMTLGIGVTTAMFLVAYAPQAFVMAFTSGPVAAISAALLTLSESSTLVNVLSRTFLIQDAIIDTFDGTLVAKDCTNLVSDGRQVKPGSDAISRLGKLVKKPFERFAPEALIRYCLYLPLNFIPVVGTVAFVILQGKRNGPSAHARFFQLKGWSKTQRDEWVEKNRGAYTSFGIAAYLFEMIPVVSFVFAFTNTVGAALWAADIEKQSTTAPNLRSQAEKAK